MLNINNMGKLYKTLFKAKFHMCIITLPQDLVKMSTNRGTGPWCLSPLTPPISSRDRSSRCKSQPLEMPSVTAVQFNGCRAVQRDHSCILGAVMRFWGWRLKYTSPRAHPESRTLTLSLSRTAEPDSYFLRRALTNAVSGWGTEWWRKQL